MDSTGKITSKEYKKDWNRIRENYHMGADTLMTLLEEYMRHLVLNQEDTYTKPEEIISTNLGINFGY